MSLTFGSLFAGVGGGDIGLERAGMKCVFQVENDQFCLSVLERRWPEVPKIRDIRNFRVDKSANLIYDSSHGWTPEELRRGRETLRSRIVNRGGCLSVRHNQASNALDTDAPGSADAPTTQVREKQSLLPRDKGRRQSAEHAGESDSERNRNQEVEVREVWERGDVQGREDCDTSTPFRLQQAAGCDVALSAMPSRMAQEEPSRTEGGKEVRFREAVCPAEVDLLVGGFP